eukprot:gene11738-biopygen11802
MACMRSQCAPLSSSFVPFFAISSPYAALGSVSGIQKWGSVSSWPSLASSSFSNSFMSATNIAPETENDPKDGPTVLMSPRSFSIRVAVAWSTFSICAPFPLANCTARPYEASPFAFHSSGFGSVTSI